MSPLQANAEGNVVWAPPVTEAGGGYISCAVGRELLWAQGELPGAQVCCVLLSPNFPFSCTAEREKGEQLLHLNLDCECWLKLVTY